MARQVLTWLAAGASAAIALATAAGLLAPFDPRFEMINHFRPYLMAGALIAFLFALLLRRRRLVAATGSIAAAIAALVAIPLLYAAPSAPATTPALRVVTFNLWNGNRMLPDAAKFLIGTNADVIVLQEVLCAASDPLFEALRPAYPHIYRASERCFGQAILSKHPILKTGRRDYSYRAPLWIWAQIAWQGRTIQVTGIHLAHPTRPRDQAVNVNDLIGYMNATKLPHVIAGDFNLTPYSWLLTKFAHASGMRRLATYQRSWPGNFAFPAFLIDHVFASGDFAKADVAVGPYIGSDHLPVIADLVLPAGAIATSGPDRSSARRPF